MFKKFIQRIIEAKDREDAIQNVFYGTVFDDSGKIVEYGIERAFDQDKITYKEFEMLSKLIDKLA